MALEPEQVRAFIAEHLSAQADAEGRDVSQELGDDYDLLLSGAIDSLGLLELMSALNELAGRELDFEALDPEEITIVGPLTRFVADQTAASDFAAS